MGTRIFNSQINPLHPFFRPAFVPVRIRKKNDSGLCVIRRGLYIYIFFNGLVHCRIDILEGFMHTGRRQSAQFNKFDNDFLCGPKYLLVDGFHTDLNSKRTRQGQEFALFYL